MACGPGMVASWPKSAALAEPDAGGSAMPHGATRSWRPGRWAYKQVLSLMIAQRRPSYYLGGSETALRTSPTSPALARRTRV